MANPAVAGRKITLYFAPGASSAFPHFLLYHCNIPFTPQAVGLKEPSALASVNDKLQVPVLAIDGNNVTENPAIAHAINQLAPDQHLFGRSPTEFIKVCEWLNWISASLHAQAWSPFIRPFRFTTDQSLEGQAAVRDGAVKNLRERFARLEKTLDVEGPWALGEQLTAVDPYLLCFFRIGRDVMKADMKGDYPKWNRIVTQLLDLDATKKLLEDEDKARKASS